MCGADGQYGTATACVSQACVSGACVDGRADDFDVLDWTNAAGANEAKTVMLPTWYEAYAFCIWDGGLLPSEAEWNYRRDGSA